MFALTDREPRPDGPAKRAGGADPRLMCPKHGVIRAIRSEGVAHVCYAVEHAPLHTTSSFAPPPAASTSPPPPPPPPSSACPAASSVMGGSFVSDGGRQRT